jgi:hypothetical protein
MSDSTTIEVLGLGRRWAEAEQRADVETLDAVRPYGDAAVAIGRHTQQPR